MLKKLVFILLALCFGFAFAQQPPGVHPSYVSIHLLFDPLDGPHTRNKICGGVVVDEARKLVATAWHCVPNQDSIISKAGTFTVSGMNAKLVAFKAEADMALFQVENLKGLKPPKFKTPQKGDLLVASAYYEEFGVFSSTQTTPDRNIPFMSVKVTLDWETKVMAVANANRRGNENMNLITPTSFKWIIVTGNPAPGFSGGPLFDTSGNFVGIISNGVGGFTNISSSENVALLIKIMK